MGLGWTAIVAGALSWAVTASAATPQPEAAKDGAGLTDLDVVAEIYFPEPQLENLMRQACRTTYQTKLANTPALVDAEKQIPGLLQHMVDASYNYCHANVPAVMQQARQHIEADWQKLATPRQIATIASVFRQAVQVLPNVDLKIGETATQGVHRQDAKLESADAALRDALTRLSHMPGGMPLAQKIIAYQKTADAEQALWQEPALDVFRKAIDQAHLAANAYAQEKGFEPLY